MSSRRASLQGVTCLALMQQGYSFRCCTIRRGDEGKRPLAVGRILAPSRRSKAPNDWGTQGRIKGGRPPLAGGRTGAVDSSSPTHKGSINQVTSSVRGSFGALPLRPTAMIRRTSCKVLLCASVYYAAGITASAGWICRVDVIRVGADLRVRPQNRLRSGEDRRTHRSAPTKGYTYHRYTLSASVVDKARRVTRCRDARSERPLSNDLDNVSL